MVTNVFEANNPAPMPVRLAQPIKQDLKTPLPETNGLKENRAPGISPDNNEHPAKQLSKVPVNEVWYLNKSNGIDPVNLLQLLNKEAKP